jgi:hypothetical protein
MFTPSCPCFSDELTDHKDLCFPYTRPDLWREIPLSKFSYDEHSAHLQLAGKKYH